MEHKMTNKKLVIDLKSGEIYEEELSQEAIDFNNKMNHQLIEEEQQIKQRIANRIAILQKLGLSQEEARLLLG